MSTAHSLPPSDNLDPWLSQPLMPNVSHSSHPLPVVLMATPQHCSAQPQGSHLYSGQPSPLMSSVSSSDNTLSSLLQNPQVEQFLTCLQRTSMQITQNTAQLSQHTAQLSQQVETNMRMQQLILAELQAVRTRVGPFLDPDLPGTPHSISPTSSVGPNDSVSQTAEALVFVRPVERPPQYPVEVLWTLDDCRDDRNVGITEANKARPPMDKAIRHADGRMISAAEWEAIKSAARLIKCQLRQLPTPRDRKAINQPKTKTFYRTYHPSEWKDAIRRLEHEHPILALCSPHWKADHVLGASLLVSSGDEKEGVVQKKRTKYRSKRAEKEDREDDNLSVLGSGIYSASAQEAASAITEDSAVSGDHPSPSHDSPPPLGGPPALANLKRHEPSSDSQKTSRPSKRRETESQTGRSSHPSSPLSSFAMGPPTSPASSAQSGIHAVPGPAEETSQVAQADGIEKLTKDELKAWIKDRKLPTPAKQCSKEDLLQAIVSTPMQNQPSASDIAKVIELRQVRKAAQKATKAGTPQVAS